LAGFFAFFCLPDMASSFRVNTISLRVRRACRKSLHVWRNRFRRRKGGGKDSHLDVDRPHPLAQLGQEEHEPCAAEGIGCVVSAGIRSS